MKKSSRHIYMYICDEKGNHVFSVREKNVIKWTDAKGKMHTVKSETDLEPAMRDFTNWINGTLKVQK